MTITQADVAAWQAAKLGVEAYDQFAEFDDAESWWLRNYPRDGIEYPAINLDTDTGLIDAVELAKIDHDFRLSSLGDEWAVEVYKGFVRIFNSTGTLRKVARAAVEAVIEQWKERE